MKRALSGIILLCLALSAWGEDIFRSDRPDSYTAVEGDTLWDIAGHFLNDPWSWRSVWEVDSRVKDPDLIYPGDVIRAVKVNGEMKLTLTRKTADQTSPERTIKLVPKIRSTPLVDALPAIPLDAIHNFLGGSRVLDGQSDIDKAPRVLANGQERVISGAGDTVYARGDFSYGEKVYGIFRKGKTYNDPKTNENLGILMTHIGSMNMKNVSNDIATMRVSRASKEVRVGDKLLVSEQRHLPTTFSPGSPNNPHIEGVILDVVDGVSNIGLYSNVVINLGSRNRMKDGDVLAIYRSKKIKDKVTGEFVELPGYRVGLVMIYRIYAKVSFAVVMQSTQPLQTGDILRAP